MKPKRIHIVGGGFSGLMTAYFCRQLGHEVIVSSAAWGGLLGTRRVDEGIVENAANGFMQTDLLTAVAHDIGVDLCKTLPGSHQRWIANDKPQRIPVPIVALAGGAARFFSQSIFNRHRPIPQETLSDWGTRVLGSKIQDRVILPAIQGIYSVDSRELSATLVLAPLFQKKRRPRRRGLVSPLTGMDDWTRKLLRHLQRQGVQLREEQLKTLPSADHVVLAVPAYAKAELLQDRLPDIARDLRGLKYSSMLSATYFSEIQGRELPGFGVLFHPDHGWRASGVLFNHQIFPKRVEGALRSETWFFPRATELPSSISEITALIEQQRARLGLKPAQNGRVYSQLWSKALPIYSVQWERQMPQMSTAENVHLTGNEFGRIGLTGLAEQAEELAHAIGG